MPDINVNKLSEALNTKADIDLNNTGVFSTSSGGVNLVQSTPSDAKGREVASADFSLKQGGLELMDVVFAPLGIDESKNKRRYLNGQVIIQEQFPAFTSAVKARMSTMANAFTTETNWQAEKTNSKFGQCGKFVVDDTAGTIRLPCVVNAQGLVDLALIGGIKNESLPNITSGTNWFMTVGGTTSNPTTTSFPASGATTAPVGSTVQGHNGNNFEFPWTRLDASLQSISYQDNAPVQQEAVQYPYCIVVNTGVEESDRPINNYQINNVYSYGMSQYYKGTMNNNSWLKSAGQWNDGTVYTGMYNWLLEQMNAGVDGFKGTIGYAWKKPNEDLRWWTAVRNPKVGDAVYGAGGIRCLGYVAATNKDGTINFFEEAININQNNLVYTESENINIEGTGFGNIKFANDYDFVVNTTDQTFRLPLLNGEENLVDYSNPTSFALATNFTVPANGIIYASVNGYQGANGAYYWTINGGEHQVFGGNQSGAFLTTVEVKRGDVFYIVGVASTNNTLYFYPYISDGNLYYYVGDTLQNAQLVNVARIEEKLTDVNAASRGYVVESYHNGTEWYRIYSDGWKEQGGVLLMTSAGVGTSHKVNLLIPFSDTMYTALGDIARVGGDSTLASHVANFAINSFDIVTNYAYVASGGDKAPWYACGY